MPRPILRGDCAASEMGTAKSSSELLVLINAVIICILFALSGSTRAELTPPYFNLAEGRKISATATCGVDSDGPELYCKLVGANTEHDQNHVYSLIQGQVCLIVKGISSIRLNE